MQLRTASRSTLALLAMLSCSAVQALSFRAYLSVDGSDSNPCSVQLPCRLLPAALNAIVDGGEVWILDSANYNIGPVTVGKSASILAVPGAVGSVVALGGPALSITASGLTVSLRNLVIVPFPGGGGTNGVEMTGASALTIEGSLIANLPQSAVTVDGAGKLKIANSIIRNNAYFAVQLHNGAMGTISGTQMLANGNGGVDTQSLSAATTTMAIVTDSLISGGNGGVNSWASADNAVAKVFVTRCTIEGVVSALDSQAATLLSTAVIAVSNSTIVGNNYAWRQIGAGAVIRSLGNNHITDNTTSQGVLTATALQ